MSKPRLDEARPDAEKALRTPDLEWAEPLVHRLANHVLALDAALRVERERAERLEQAAREYRKWVDLASSYPGHEEYDEDEWVEIQREKDAAQETLDAVLVEQEKQQ